MPFPIRALQVDGGSEFAAEFELACQQRGLHLFVLAPRSPKLNGSVERANRAHAEEFYPVTPCSLEMKTPNRELRQWEKIYNTVRPHQSLGYLNPATGMKLSLIYWTSTESILCCTPHQLVLYGIATLIRRLLLNRSGCSLCQR